MFQIDIRTLYLVTTLISIVSAVALIFLWRSQSRRNGAGFWATGMSCIAVSSILLTARGLIPDFISIVVANSLYVLGFLLILRGIRVFADRPALLFLDFSLPPIVAVLFYYFNYIDQNISIRIAIASLAYLIVCSVIVVTLLRDKNAPWRTAGFAVSTVFGLFGIFHGIRGAISLLNPSDNGLMYTNVFSSLVILAGLFLLWGSAITLILLARATLESELRIASLAVNHSASSIMITDTSGAIEYVNPAFTDKTGYDLEEVIGKNPRVLRSGKTNPQEYSALWKALSTGKTWRGEFHNSKKNGELFWEIASIAPVKQRNGHISHYVAVKEDITALKTAEQHIIHMANHDALTGLPTRRLAMDRLINNLTIAKRNQTKMAVLFIDIDGFKAVNDTLGHDVGDHVLTETATRLSACVREVDTVARVGGDEFWILLSNISDRKCIISVAEKLIKAVATVYQCNSNEINISASIGIALYPENAKNPQALVNLADQAMYKIKHQGKNNYAFSEKFNTAEVTNTTELSL